MNQNKTVKAADVLPKMRVLRRGIEMPDDAAAKPGDIVELHSPNGGLILRATIASDKPLSRHCRRD